MDLSFGPFFRFWLACYGFQCFSTVEVKERRRRRRSSFLYFRRTNLAFLWIVFSVLVYGFSTDIQCITRQKFSSSLRRDPFCPLPSLSFCLVTLPGWFGGNVFLHQTCPFPFRDLEIAKYATIVVNNIKVATQNYKKKYHFENFQREMRP